MAFAKTSGFSPKTIQTADLARAIAHPARIAILQILLKKNSCVCGGLVDELPLSQSTVSQHLKVLRETGLIQGSISGPSVCYCIDPEGWKAAKALFEGLFRLVDIEGSCC